MEGVVSFTGWVPDPKVPESMEFANKFWDWCKRNGLKRNPGDYAVSAYIGVHAFAKAVNKKGTADDVDAIIDGIYSLQEEGWVTPRGVRFEILPGGLEYSPGEYIQVIRNGKVEILDHSPLTREDFGPPYAAPGYKTLLELEKEAKATILNRLKMTTNLNDAKDCDVAIESVFEQEDSKWKALAELDQVCPAETILISNTFSFLIH